MELTKNVDFLQKIDNTIKSIMKDGKINQFDIPEIMLLITDLVTTSEKTKVTSDQLKNSINVLYEYIMTHYNLFPEDVEQKKSFTKLFEMCVNLIMFQPKVKQSCKSIFPCMA